MTEGIPESNRLVFTTPTHLAQQIDAKIQQCFETRSGCRILITGVGEEEMDGPIDEAFYKLGIRRAVKFTWEGPLRSLIINYKG